MSAIEIGRYRGPCISFDGSEVGARGVHDTFGLLVSVRPEVSCRKKVDGEQLVLAAHVTLIIRAVIAA